MNSIEKYEEIVHEWGSWEKYMDSLKPMQNISNMQNRIQIDGVWYVRENSQPQDTYEDIEVTKCLTCIYETAMYRWEASRIFRDDDTIYPGVNIKFMDKKHYDYWDNTFETEYWDNDDWFLGVYNNEPEALEEAKKLMDEQGIKDFKNFIHKLIQMGWLTNE